MTPEQLTEEIRDSIQAADFETGSLTGYAIDVDTATENVMCVVGQLAERCQQAEAERNARAWAEQSSN